MESQWNSRRSGKKPTAWHTLCAHNLKGPGISAPHCYTGTDMEIFHGKAKGTVVEVWRLPFTTMDYNISSAMIDSNDSTPS